MDAFNSLPRRLSLSASPRLRVSACLSVFLAAILLIPACRHQNCDLVEAELRSKETQLEDLKVELDKRTDEVDGLEKQVDALRRQSNKPATEPAALGLIVKSVTLGRRTGGYDLDFNTPGDEALLVAVEPRDFQDHAIKAGGSLHVDAYEVNVQGMKTLLSSWDVPPNKLRETWEISLLGTPSYRVTLPWQKWPTTDRLRIAVEFTASDGQKFEADKDVIIKLSSTPKPKSAKAAPVDEKAEPLKAPKSEPQGPNLVLPSAMKDRPPPPQPPAFDEPATAYLPPSPPPPASQVQVSAGRYPSDFYQSSPPPAAPAPRKGLGLRPPANARPAPAPVP